MIIIQYRGTSFAAPQVSAIAALLFSINNNLTALEVRNIIESTAQKVGGYSYTTTSGYGNGTWNNEMGYGLVNAYAAVLSVYPTLSGSDFVCSSGTTFTVDNLPIGTTIGWSQSPNITRVSSQGSNPCAFSANSNGVGWIEAVINNPNCDSIILPRKDVWVGNPSFTWDYVNSDTELSPFEYGFAYPVYAVDEVAMGLIFASTDWSYTGPLTSIAGNLQLGKYRAGRNLGYGYIRYEVANTCGSTWHELYYEVVDNWYLSVSPNPATDEATLTIESVRSEAIDISTEWALEIYDQMQIVKTKKVKLKGDKYKINTSGWQGGMYFVRIKFKDKILSGKFLVNS
ncbi:MAG: S8 family serine peptidase [Bacteroidales bacterium]|nr:S8 family serine peptidase [Bacteroidales bacterium]